MKLDYPGVRPRCLRDMVVQKVGVDAGERGDPITSCPYRKHQRRYCWEHGWRIGARRRTVLGPSFPT